MDPLSLLLLAKYGYSQSDGDRTSSMGISTNAVMLGGTINNHIDGGYNRNTTDCYYWTNGQTDKYVTYDFGTPHYVTEFIISLQVEGAITSTSGIWELQGSNDEISYTPVSEQFDWRGTPSVVRHRVYALPGYNTPYRYFRLTQLSGATAQNPWQIEIVFRTLPGDGTSPDIAPSYDRFFGRGSRRDSLIVTAGSDQGTLFNTSSIPGYIVDGLRNNSNYFVNNRTGAWILFEFPHPVVIDEATWLQDVIATHGTWRWRGSNDAVNWDLIGGTFTLGSATDQIIETLHGNTNEYTFYELRQVSGSTSSTNYTQEIQFRLGVKGTSPVDFTSDLVLDYTLEAAEGFQSSLTLDYQLIQDLLNSDTGFDYKLLEFFEADLQLDYFMEETQPLRVTQQPALALVLENLPTKVTQLPILAAVLPEQNTLITQQVLMPLVFYRDVPRPADLLPISPIKEVWQWLTAVNISTGSKEQRAALRPNPRYRIHYDFILRDQDQRRALYNLIYKSQDKFFEYPMYHAWARINGESPQGDNRLYFNPSHTDIRQGEKLAIFDTFTQRTTTHSVVSMEPNGAYIADDLDRPIGPGHVVCPVSTFRMTPRNHTLSMVGASGSGSIVIESLGTRPLVRVPVSIPSLLGAPILDKKPINEADELLDRGVEWLDTGTSAPAFVSRWPYARMNGRREFKLDRQTDMDWWRQLMNYANGQRRFFWLQSFFNDLPLIVDPPLGSNVFTTDNLDAFEFLRVNSSYKALAFHTANGIVYRQVGMTWLNYDSSGNPISTSFTILSPLGSNPGDNIIEKVSYLYSVRLGSDEVEITHEVGYSVIAFDIQAVNQ